MTFKNSLKKYKVVLIIFLSVLAVIVAAFIGPKQKFDETIDFMRKQINRFSKFKRTKDDEAFERLEKIEKKKDEIIADIEKRHQVKRRQISTEHKLEVERQLNEFEGNEKELEDWYRQFLNSNIR